MTSLSKKLIVLGILILIAGGAVLLNEKGTPQKDKKEISLTQESFSQNPESRSESENKASQWVLFRSVNGGYELKYPQDWKKFEQVNGYVKFQKVDNLQGKFTFVDGREIYPPYNIIIDVARGEGSLYSSIEELANRECPGNIIKYEKVSGLKAVRCNIKQPLGGAVAVFFIHGDDKWSITYGWLQEETREKYLPVFDELVSSFRFLQ